MHVVGVDEDADVWAGAEEILSDVVEHAQSELATVSSRINRVHCLGTTRGRRTCKKNCEGLTAKCRGNNLLQSFIVEYFIISC